jgi:hypothetical protein
MPLGLIAVGSALDLERFHGKVTGVIDAMEASRRKILGLSAPSPMAARPGQGPRRPMRGAHGGPPQLPLLDPFVIWKK